MRTYSKDLMLIFIAIIGIVAILAIGVPITSALAEDAKYTTHKIEGGSYTLAEDPDEVTIEIYGKTDLVTINGKKYDVNKYGTYVVSNNVLLNFVPQDQPYHSIFFGGQSQKINVNESSLESLIIQFKDGEAVATKTASDGTTTVNYTMTYDYILHYSGGVGNYVSGYVTTAPVNEDSRIFIFQNQGGFGETKIAAPATASSGTSSIRLYPSGSTTPTTDTVTWTLTDLGDGSYTITNPTYDGNTITSGAIPNKYTTYGDNPVSQITSLIPIILTIMLLVLVAAGISYGRFGGGSDI